MTSSSNTMSVIQEIQCYNSDIREKHRFRIQLIKFPERTCLSSFGWRVFSQPSYRKSFIWPVSYGPLKSPLQLNLFMLIYPGAPYELPCCRPGMGLTHLRFRPQGKLIHPPDIRWFIYVDIPLSGFPLYGTWQDYTLRCNDTLTESIQKITVIAQTAVRPTKHTDIITLSFSPGHWNEISVNCDGRVLIKPGSSRSCSEVLTMF